MTLSHFNSFCHKLLSAFLSFVIFVAPLAPIFHTTSVYAYDGCMDPGYLEYDPGADNDPGGYCITPKVPGCTDPTAFNYNPSANFDNGSCVPVVMGCTNNIATNYNPSANVNDGSCTFDTTPPNLASLEVSGSTLTVHYEEFLSGSSVPSPSDFTLLDGGNVVSIDSVTHDSGLGNFILNLNVPISTYNILLSYTAGVSPMKDQYTNTVENFTNKRVLNTNSFCGISTGSSPG